MQTLRIKTFNSTFQKKNKFHLKTIEEVNDLIAFRFIFYNKYDLLKFYHHLYNEKRIVVSNNEIIDSNNSSSTDELENNIQENIPNSEKLAQDLIGFDVEWSRILKESHLGDSTDNNLTLVNKYGRGVASDNDGSIFIVGYESSENDFNKKSYFSKLSSGGEQEWEKLFTSSNNSSP